MGSNSRVHGQFTVASNSGSSFPSSYANVTHISCDGFYDDPSNPIISFEVFAWDGSKQGWAYVYNSNSPVVMSISSWIHPEIALVSDNRGQDIYAIILSQKVATDAAYEAYKWNNSTSSFPTTPTYSGILKSGTVNDRVVSIAGDQHGHFAMVCDDGYNGSTTLTQLTGYIDGNGALVFGTISTITYGGVTISEPDIDITYDNNSQTYTDAIVAVTFVEGNSVRILSNTVDQTTLFAGTSWDSKVGGVLAKADASFGSAELLDQPSISINDGYLTEYNNNFSTTSPPNGTFPLHYGVAYRVTDNSLSPATSDIKLYQVTLANKYGLYQSKYTSSPNIPQTALSTGNVNATYELNTHPTIVVEPMEVEAVVAWNFSNINGYYPSNTLEGLANRFWYPFNYTTTNILDYGIPQGTSPDMLINPTNAVTSEVAISGYNEDYLLYFYYESSSTKLYYKLAPFYSNSLRTSKKNMVDNIIISPNPFTEKIKLDSKNPDANYIVTITDITGRLVGSFKGKANQIEEEINSQFANIPTGCNLIKFIASDGTFQTSKLIKK